MWRSRLDLPQFTRCCFCIPLRYGILLWAYLKVGALALSALVNTAALFDPEMSVTKVIIILMCIVLYMDILCTILCIIAGHMKHRRGLKIYFYFSLAILIAFVTVSLSYTVASSMTYEIYLAIIYKKYSRYIKYQWIVAMQEIFIMLLAVFVQTYVLLLVRSEILKLSNPPNLQLVNNDVEANKSDNNAILREEQEATASKIEDVAYSY